jgi:hypothetical protein
MIQSAEEFLKGFHRQEAHTLEEGVQEAMIEFTKLHVEAALKAASENAESYVIGGLTSEVERSSILTAYPLENIK